MLVYAKNQYEYRCQHPKLKFCVKVFYGLHVQVHYIVLVLTWSHILIYRKTVILEPLFLLYFQIEATVDKSLKTLTDRRAEEVKVIIHDIQL